MIANTYVVKPFGISEVKVIALKGDPGVPTQEQVNNAVDEYMTEHPEAQIPDGSITEQKLSSDVVATLNDVDNKADKVGSYPDLIAGTADNLLSSSYQTDRTPYIIRRTPFGVREKGSIVGGSIVWNQLVQVSNIPATKTVKGVTFTNNGDGTFTANGTATDNIQGSDYFVNAGGTSISGHKYLLKGCPSGGSATTYYAYDGYSGIDYGNGFLGEIRLLRVYVGIKSGTTVNNLVFKPQLFDLTLMFGPAIADYIYAQEQATAGAGVAFFRSLFDKPYYPYNAGEIISVKTSAHKMVGFNQWDEEWENGYLSTSTGQNSGSSSAHYRSKNYIPVFPNGTYYFLSAKDIRVFMYRADKSYIDYKTAFKNVTRTLDADCHYIRFDVPNGGNHEEGSICVNISDPQRNGTYEPYTAHTYPLDSSLTLRGLPKLDGDSIYYDGDVYKADGTVERRYKLFNLGEQTWTYNATSAYFYADVDGKALGNWNILCSKYSLSSAQFTAGMQDKEIKGNATNNAVFVKDSAYTDAASFKTAMSGVMLLAELATPESFTAESYTALQICDPNGTEEFVGASMPVGHETKYYADLKGKIEDIPDAPSADGTYTLKVTISNGVATYSWW